MLWQAWLSLGVVIGTLSLLIFTRLAPHWILLAALTILSATGVLTTEQALQGFANSGLLTVAAMYIVAAGIYSSGGIDLLVNGWLGKPSTPRGALLRMSAPVIALSGVLNNTPVVATMIPAIHAWSRKIGIPASQLMIPLSYCSMLGGTLTMIGTSTNLVVNGQYRALTGETGFSMFAITAVGLPVAFVGLGFMLMFFPRWLPNKNSDEAFANLREFTLEVSVDPTGPLVGKSVAEAGLRHLKRVFLVEIERADHVVTAVASEERLKGGDRLVFAGDIDAIADLLRIRGIVASPENGANHTLSSNQPERCLVEVVVSTHCSAIGQAIRDAKFRERYGAVVLAVARDGERVKGNLGTTVLAAGDTLLLEARPSFIIHQKFNKDFLLISDLASETPRHHRAAISWLILLLIIATAGFGLTSLLNAAFVGAGLMLLTGCCSISQAEKSFDFPVLVTIAASFALGAALQETGVAAKLAEYMTGYSNGSALMLLIMTYIAVSLLTEVISNNAAAILMLPITLAITASGGFNSEPFVVAIMMAASASFATPLGYQTNLMVYGPGGYKASDFIKVGIPMNVVIGSVSILMIWLIWPLHA